MMLAVLLLEFLLQTDCSGKQKRKPVREAVRNFVCEA
jgi:hypothetical protein